MPILSDTSLKLQRTCVPGRQTVPPAELWRAIQVLSRVDEQTNIQIPIDAKYVTGGITHRGELEQGPNGDLRSILFQLIDGRIKVKSHLEDVGPPAIKQNKIEYHHMLANSLADVVAEEAAKRLFPDVNLEREATKAERIGVRVAKRLAFVQADIWVKRGEAGEICEFDPLLEEEEMRTRSAIGRLVDELAHQGHLLARHNNGLQCKACNVYRSDRQFKFLEQNHLVSLGHVRPTSPVSHQERTPTRPQSIRFAASLVFPLFLPV